mgnify:FL=1
MSIQIEDNLLQLKSEMVDELQNVLNFWSSEVVDNENSGFLGRIDCFGNKFGNASKGSVLNTRILWTFSAAFLKTNNIKYKNVADKAFQYIKTNFYDINNGGLFWEVDCLGKPINKRKQAYAQGFGIYAFSEYYRATKNEESLTLAKDIYKILETKFWDNKYGGYIEALTQDWHSIEDMRLSDKDQNAPKSMNTHLHIIEPYANLYRVWPDKQLKKSIEKLLHIFIDKIIDKNTGHFNLFFEMNWKPNSTAISFGHDIEGAWLLHEAALLIEEEAILNQIKNTALNLVDLTVKKGLDRDGSLYNEFNNNHLDSDKHWWPQAEAMVGLIDAYQISFNEEYLKGVFKLWKFIKNNIIDTVNGEWFWRVDFEGNPNTTDDKIGFWKCPYHNTRALIEVANRIDELLKDNATHD